MASAGNAAWPGPVLFEQRFWAGIAEGRVTLMFRRWRRPQVVAGRPYRTSGGTRVQVTAIGVVAPTEITDADAARTGHGSAAEVLADLRGRPADPIYRVEFHRLEEPDPRAELAAAATLTDADVHDITRRLERLDRASGHGPWTSATLHAIAAQPGAGPRPGRLVREGDPGVQDRCAHAQEPRPDLQPSGRRRAVASGAGVPASHQRRDHGGLSSFAADASRTRVERYGQATEEVPCPPISRTTSLR